MKACKIMVKLMAAVLFLCLMAPMAANAAVQQEYKSVYNENFENSAILNTIQNKQDGWNWGSYNADGSVQIDWRNDIGFPTYAIRFDSKDWYKTMWMPVDIEQNWVSKKVAAGVDSSAAQAEADGYLSGDLRLSFQVYFDVPDGNAKDNGCKYYIKIKDSNYTPFAALLLEVHKDVEWGGDGQSTLSLIALNGSKTQNIRYNIATGNENVFRKIFTVEMYLKRSDNTYQMKVNGNTISTDNGTWIPASSTNDIGTAWQTTFGDLLLKQIEFGLDWSCWWATMTIDNIDVAVLKDVVSSYVDTTITNVYQVDRGSSDYYVQAAFMNNKGTTLNTKGLFVMYGANKKVVGLSIMDLAIDGENGAMVDRTITCKDVPTMVKVFVLDSLDNMLPMSCGAESENIYYYQ